MTMTFTRGVVRYSADVRVKSAGQVRINHNAGEGRAELSEAGPNDMKLAGEGGAYSQTLATG